MTTPNLPPLLLWAIPFFIAALLFEYAYLRKRRANYDLKDGLTSILMGLGMLASDLLMGAFSFSILMALWPYAVMELGYSLPIILLAYILWDFQYYWKHLVFHKMRYWWMSHNVHHSSQHYNFTTALRQPWTNHIGFHVLLSLPMVLLGFHPVLILFVATLNLIYQFWIHTEAIHKMPKWFEAVMNTPSHHRVHHGINTLYLDANFGGTFIIWDRIFGTFVPETEKPRYGLVHQLDTYNPLTVAFHELISIIKDAFQAKITFKQRLLYIFGPPGYSHDGRRKTVKRMKSNPHQSTEPTFD